MSAKTKQKNIPELRFPGFDGEWEEKKLKDLASITTGNKDVNQGNPEGEYPFFTCAREHTYSDTYSFKGEAITIAGNADVGLCTYYKGKFEAYQRTYILQDFKINGKYLFGYLSHCFRNYALGLKQTGAMSYIKIGMLEDYTVPVPDKEEQQKIASFLGAVDRWVENLKTQKENLEQYKKGLMQKIFSQEIRFKDDDGSNFPVWEEKKLGEVAKIIAGQSPKSSTYNTEGVGLPLVQGKEDILGDRVKTSRFTSEPTRESLSGDLLFSVRAPVGEVFKNQQKICIGRGFAAIRTKNNIHKSFAFYALERLGKELARVGQGSIFSSIATGKLRKESVVIPSFSEQQKIGNFLTSVDTVIESKEKQISAVERWKKGLMQKMFV